MRLLLCCLAFASVAVSFGTAQNVYQDLYKCFGILRSAIKNIMGWSDIQLTPEMLFEIFAIFIPEGSAKSLSEVIFRIFDSDNNGRIDIKELLLVTKFLLNAKPEEKVDWAFQMYDANGDGTIERSEMTEIIKIFYDMMGPWLRILDPSDTPEGKTRDIIAEMDDNNDGVLSKDEFFLGCLDDEFISQILNANYGEGSE